jgi:hypothetical protein
MADCHRVYFSTHQTRIDPKFLTVLVCPAVLACNLQRHVIRIAFGGAHVVCRSRFEVQASVKYHLGRQWMNRALLQTRGKPSNFGDPSAPHLSRRKMRIGLVHLLDPSNYCMPITHSPALTEHTSCYCVLFEEWWCREAVRIHPQWL